MRKWIAVSFVVGVLVGAAIVPAGLASAPRPTSVAGQREPHPQINRAIVALETAKAHLKRAAHDFGGHRVAAIAAIDKALEQLKLALEFDKT
jgi:hypothetical protein